jgi:putative ABC transport system substrate-binding protein
VPGAPRPGTRRRSTKINRRRLVVSLAAALGASALPARAQTRLRRVSWFTLGDRQSADGYVDAVREGLRDLGYQEGRDLALEVHAANFSADRGERIAAELIALRPALIVAQGPATRVMARQPPTVPVVFGFSGDPVDAGAAASMARPGRNLTGMTFMALDLVAKRMEILKEALPRLRRVAIIANPEHPGEHRELAVSRTAAERLGIEVSYHPAKSATELQSALASSLEARAEAFVVFPDALTNARRGEIVAFSLKNGVPGISGWGVFADSGLLLSYGPNLRDSWYRIASYVDRILKGANPAELPIETPRNVELVVNLTTARTLGIRIPQTVLARADRVIE